MTLGSGQVRMGGAVPPASLAMEAHLVTEPVTGSQPNLPHRVVVERIKWGGGGLRKAESTPCVKSFRMWNKAG